METQAQLMPQVDAGKLETAVKLKEAPELLPMELAPVVEMPEELMPAGMAQTALAPAEPPALLAPISRPTVDLALGHSSQALTPDAVPYAGIAVVSERDKRATKRQQKAKRVQQAAAKVAAAPARVYLTITSD